MPVKEQSHPSTCACGASVPYYGRRDLFAAITRAWALGQMRHPYSGEQLASAFLGMLDELTPVIAADGQMCAACFNRALRADAACAPTR